MIAPLRPARRRAVLLCLIAVLLPLAVAACGGKKAKSPTPTPTAKPGAPPGGQVLQDLQQLVGQGKLDKSVLDELVAKGAADGIVVLNEDVVTQRLKQAAAVIGVNVSDQQLADLRTTQYDQIKQQIVALYPGTASIVQNFKSFGSVLVHFTSGETLLSLLKRPEVAGVTANEQYAAPTPISGVPGRPGAGGAALADRVRGTDEAEQSNPRPPLSVSLALIDQPAAAAAGFTGEGTAVAILDTGVDFRRDAFSCSAPGQPAACRVAVFQHIAPDDGRTDSDAQGMHGTNVAGIVAAVAPGAKIVSLDIFDSGHTSSSLELAGLDWVMQHRAQYNIVSVNMSVGASRDYHTTPCSESPLTGAYEQLRRAGILPLVAAGNDAMASGAFVNGIEKPACAPGAVSVGAVYVADIGRTDFGDCGDQATKADLVACFSQSGPTLGLLAPGSRITAAGITESGTSQATPHAAGAVAAIVSKCKGASADNIEKALTSSGPQIVDRRNNVSKHRLDVAAAGRALLTLGCPGTTPPPQQPRPSASAGPTQAQPTQTAPTQAPAPTRTAPALYQPLLETRFDGKELPSGFSNAQPAAGTPSNTEQQHGAVAAVDVGVHGPDDVDLLYYTFFPTASDARALFDDLESQPDTKPGGFGKPVACAGGTFTTDGGQKIGVTRCIVLVDDITVTAISGITRAGATRGNDKATIALAKAGLSHLQKVQKGK
ncbi:MAG TPA: S8 family serine peptidase [Dehalococcoidia bacterium]|nr:S8 family serine peptidase [Dehalococcoidia bacterium]